MSEIRCVFLFFAAAFLILFPIAVKVYSRHVLIQQCHNASGSSYAKGFEVSCTIETNNGTFIWKEFVQ